jgi:DNA polymerase-4
VAPEPNAAPGAHAAPPHILHVDMDAFFASVELRDRPELAGKPVCVGGRADARGVIAAASYEARKFGVRSAMPTARAEALCPGLVLLPPDFEKYTRESRVVMEIFQHVTPLVEPLSLDEAFLDVSGCERLFGAPRQIAEKIRRDILRETGLTASVGVAHTKFLAKLASDLCKPDGLRVIEPDEVPALLAPLPIGTIPGVGERTARHLSVLGVQTIGDVAALTREAAGARLGAIGTWIHDLARGLDTRRVTPSRPEKSHGHERTFARDVTDRAELTRSLLAFSEQVAWDLRRRGLRGRTVQLKVRFWNFQTLTRSRTLEFPTNLGPRIYAVARELLERVPRDPVRLVGVSVSALEDVRAPLQAELFEAAPGAAPGGAGGDARLAKATPGMDKLRAKYGPGVIGPASLL